MAKIIFADNFHCMVLKKRRFHLGCEQPRIPAYDPKSFVEEHCKALTKSITDSVVVPRDNVYYSPELLLRARTDAADNKRKNLEILSR